MNGLLPSALQVACAAVVGVPVLGLVWWNRQQARLDTPSRPGDYPVEDFNLPDGSTPCPPLLTVVNGED